MKTTAGALLVKMSLRLALQQSGVTHPAPEVQRATLDLVRKLSDVGTDESIEVNVDATRKVCAYVRVSTDEVLAEFAIPPIQASHCLAARTRVRERTLMRGSTCPVAPVRITPGLSPARGEERCSRRLDVPCRATSAREFVLDFDAGSAMMKSSTRWVILFGVHLIFMSAVSKVIGFDVFG